MPIKTFEQHVENYMSVKLEFAVATHGLYHRNVEYFLSETCKYSQTLTIHKQQYDLSIGFFTTSKNAVVILIFSFES